MSQATVYATSQFGLAADVTATGLFVGTVSFSNSSETATAPDHIGCDVGLAVYNFKKDVSVDGIVATKGSNLVANIGSTITLANSSHNSRTRLAEQFSGTAASGAAIIVTGGETSGTATGFETGSITGIYHPFVATGSPTVLT
jgi:hypothetical protein